MSSQSTLQVKSSLRRSWGRREENGFFPNLTLLEWGLADGRLNSKGREAFQDPQGMRGLRGGVLGTPRGVKRRAEQDMSGRPRTERGEF